ncbi:DEAD/DEAH box helicase [Govanella unica]|uniref:DEAD/DEAH box helicase n=1 Tax=Govanella unica TaxID=2975056 RepID=A0A9X3Z7M8_9PROT|nr:DEAD/DEAH box helicase [Govania unica]MDA5194223.1 DEAD/DEAH box helicase [Govania unica]
MSSAFDKLARPVQKWIRSQGWGNLRDIQVQAIHIVIGGEADLIISASTAGGKTEAAFLPLISQLLDLPSDKSGFDLLYIGPLKALISDQTRRLEDICREAELPVIPWHGDVSASVKSRALKQPKGILLITPESLEALFVRRGLEVPRLFGATRAVVIDELHSVLDSERGVQLRSLLTRLEQAVKRPIRRIGLSATLGDMELSQTYLRPDDAANVELIEARGDTPELKLQLRGYTLGDTDEDAPSAIDAIARHLFTHLRGSDNLVFAGSRQSVEIYADRLRSLCEEKYLPQEFYPHHASLSRDHREFIEQRLKDGRQPTTAICTSTLELGIDIGDVTCVAQIGAPFSVAALRQRLGRSGRREGRPQILRQYAVEARLTSKSHINDRLRLGLVRAVAMIELLLEKWCEPPKPQALHLSTLVHQILSMIAEHGGAHAARVFRILCQDGPFRQVTMPLFIEVLRAMGQSDVGLIEQADDGLLLLGPTGEKLVEHYSFYAVFRTPEEYRLIADGRELGTLPIDNLIAPGMMLIFSGQRWLVQEVNDADRVILVTPAKVGMPPIFEGDPGDIHDRVIERMFDILAGDSQPIYMDKAALLLLDEARGNYAQLQFDPGRIAQIDENSFLLAMRCGTVKVNTLALALRSKGFRVQSYDGFLEVVGGNITPPLRTTLETFAGGGTAHLFEDKGNLIFEKFHPWMTTDLLQLDALSVRLNLGALADVCRDILQG